MLKLAKIVLRLLKLAKIVLSIVLKLVHQKFFNPKTELKPAKIVLLMALRLVLTFMLKFE